MKRSELRPDPEKVRAWIQRSRAKAAAGAASKPRKGLARASKPLARRQRRRKARVPADTRAAVLRRTGGRCAVPGCDRRAEHLHHVFPEERWPALALEPDNLAPVCGTCHGNHHAVAGHGEPRRLPRRAVRHAARLAEGDPAMEDYLARTYPTRRTRDSDEEEVSDG